MNRAREAWIMLMADRRKASALGLLGLVLLVLVGKQLFEGGPRRASASEGTSENEILDGGRRAITLDELQLRGPIIEVELAEGADRNVFGFDPRYFPDPTQSTSSSEVGEKLDPEEDETSTEDTSARLEKVAQLVREEAETLRLKSILMGPNPMAVIASSSSGRGAARTLRVGDQVNGFTLVSVGLSRVVLEKHGVRVELER